MLYVNRCTWSHILEETARVMVKSREDLLSSGELAAIDGQANPGGILW